jgi:hypothetical protein
MLGSEKLKESYHMLMAKMDEIWRNDGSYPYLSSKRRGAYRLIGSFDSITTGGALQNNILINIIILI